MESGRREWIGSGRGRGFSARLWAALVLLPMLGGVAACGGPFLLLPGGALSGTVVDPPPASWAGEEDGIFELETRPDDPYSVQLNYFVRNGAAYVDPAEGRAWLDHLREDPRVRARIGDSIYLLEAVRVEDPEELEGFDPERLVYRLQPRAE